MEQNEVGNRSVGWEVDHAEIAERANQLWRSRGCPDGSAQQDWFEAEEQLRARRNSQNTLKAQSQSGSVQR